MAIEPTNPCLPGTETERATGAMSLLSAVVARPYPHVAPFSVIRTYARPSLNPLRTVLAEEFEPKNYRVG